MNSFDVSSQEHRNYKFILGIDFEKVLESGFTGYSTSSGDILSVKFTNKDTTEENYAHNMQILLHSDQILEIKIAALPYMINLI